MADEDLLGRFLDFGAKVATPFVQDLTKRGQATDGELKAERQYWNQLNGSGAVDGQGSVNSGTDSKNLTIRQVNPNAQDGPAAKLGSINTTTLLIVAAVGLLIVLVISFARR